MQKRVVSTKRKPERPGEHPLEKWFGSSANDPYWDHFLAAVRRARTQATRLDRKSKK